MDMLYPGLHCEVQLRVIMLLPAVLPGIEYTACEVLNLMAA